MTTYPPKGFDGTGDAPGPHRSDEFHSGDPYEISDGHLIECEPTGGGGSKQVMRGGSFLCWDPAVEEAGVDTGFSPEPTMLRAPDIAIGNVPDEPGWVEGAPELAVEYADIGQDEAALARKIKDLLRFGTKFLWVVRLTGPRRVEVYEAGKPMVLMTPGQELKAPGVLQNPVPVEAMFDAKAAREMALKNLLGRYGYKDLDEVKQEARKEGREEGREEGRVEALRLAIRDMAVFLGIPWEAERERAVGLMHADALWALWQHLLKARAWPPPA